MTDDRFDRELGARLRAYESRLPDAPPPPPGPVRRRGTGLPVLLGGGTALLAAIVLILVALQGWEPDRVGDPVLTQSATASPARGGSAEPSASATPAATPAVTGSAAPSDSASTQPAESPAPPSGDLAWSVIRSFPSDDPGPSMVEHLVAFGDGYVAAGALYEAQLPGIGPTPPHALTTWLSPDGDSWEQVDTGLENVQFTALVVRADGVLLATGRRGILNEFGIVETMEQGAWTSADGRAWEQTSIGMPTVPTTIVRGAQGYLALSRPDLATEVFELWHSPDAMIWTAVRDVAAGWIDVGAGEEGFVVIGTTDSSTDETFVIASGDGREWFDASNPPPAYSPLIAALGPDWIAMSAFGMEDGTGRGQTWTSADGLDWQPHGQAPMRGVQVDGAECQEYARHLRSAGAWVVAATDLAYPCSEGSFVIHGTQLISSDGATWAALPFDVGTPGETRSGSAVNAAVATDDGRLLLAGELDGVATFWMGERP